jgi:uncharacterized protein
VRSNRFHLLLIVVLASSCFPAQAASAQAEIPAVPVRWATDTAGFISAQTVAELDSSLESFERETGHQVLLYIGKTTGGLPIEEWAFKVFESWKTGRKGIDDGLILFIMADDRKIRVEVGYGLEGVVPDALAGRVINDILIPKIRSGDADGAVREAVARLLDIISGKEGRPSEPEAGPSKKQRIPPLFIIIAAVIFLIIFITNPSLALWLLFNILSGGRMGGGGGGGFRGGGGRSGGGGASGSW